MMGFFSLVVNSTKNSEGVNNNRLVLNCLTFGFYFPGSDVVVLYCCQKG